MRKILRNTRKAKKLTQAELAKAAGITVTSYQRIEYGIQTPSLSTASLIARKLNSTIDELFGLE